MNTKNLGTRVGAILLTGAVAFAGAALPATAATDAPSGDTAVGSPLDSTATEAAPTASAENSALAAYGGDPAKEAELVAQEDRRLIYVDMIASGAIPSLTFDRTLPYRVAGEPVTTLVLPARDAAYTEKDLAALAPLSFVETSPGVYLLSENVVVLDGATLDLRRPGGMQINLASTDNGFASIVVDGGNLVVEGTPTEQVKFQGWDAQRSEPDTNTADGRAYIRVMGGYASITNATFANLGFWSGNTGGLSLTGTQLASTLGLDASDGRELPEVYVAAPEGATSVDPGDPLVVDGSTDGETGVNLTQGTGLYSNGVTAWLSGLTINGNAYGLFVSDANSVELQNSTVTGSLVDGVVFHREVVNSRISSVESSRNNGDGFVVSRGSQGIMLDTVTATNNGGNGITIDATPLADGPSATGLSTAAYGGHSVVNSRVTDNARYGIAILGGTGVTVRSNTIEGGEFGLMAGDAAQNVIVQENRVSDATKQGIAFRDGSQGEVSGNIVNAGEIGIYSRDSQVSVVRNTINEVTSHGITFVGLSTGSVVAQNLVDGQGNSPIDTVRATGATVLDTNESPSWVYQNITERVLRVVTRPMTLLWTILAVLLLLTAFRGFRYRGSGFGNPYRDRTPLHELTRGMVDPATVPGVRVPLEAELREAQTHGQQQAQQAASAQASELPRRRPDHESVNA